MLSNTSGISAKLPMNCTSNVHFQKILYFCSPITCRFTLYSNAPKNNHSVILFINNPLLDS